MKPVGVIGGGITGLTAALRLRNLGVPVTLYEAGDRVGGVIQSVRREGYLAEFGPNAVLETSPVIRSLVDELGLERLYSDPGANARYLVRRRKPVALPGSPWGFLSTPLFSVGAKLRLMREPFIPAAPPEQEESLAEFVVRRLGREFLDYAINPFVAGVYAGDPSRLSVRHAFPKLHAVEQQYGSLIKGQVFGAKERQQRKEVSKARAPKFSFAEGLGAMTEAMHRTLSDVVKLNAPVRCVREMVSGWEVEWESNGVRNRSAHSAVLLSSPAHRLADVRLETRGNATLKPLGDIPYPPVASVVLGFRRADVEHSLKGFGVLIPEVERYRILGTIFSSSLFPGRAPQGHVLLTSYVGGVRAPELAGKQSDALVDLTVEDLRELLGVSGQPTFSHVKQFPKAIPQYEVGFGRFKEFMDRLESAAPGLFLAGHFRDGISLSDSIVSGHNVAERIAGFVRSDRDGGGCSTGKEKDLRTEAGRQG